MKKLLFLSILAFFLAAPASAQQSTKPEARESLRDRAIKRCKENRGTDCDSDRGLREWLREERPITDAEQQAAAGARRHRELCAKNKKAQGC